MVLINVHSVFKIFEGKEEDIGVAALRGIDLEIEEGESILISGSSGSGKSTLLSIIAGYKKPSAGYVAAEGVGIIHKLQNRSLLDYHRNYLSFISQFPEKNVIYSWTVKENIELPLLLSKNIEKSKRRTRVNEILEGFGLNDLQNSPVSVLSGGETQLVAAAMAVVNQPRILLADEPTGELDSTHAKKVIDVLLASVEQQGTTILVVSHNTSLRNSFSRNLVICDGNLADD